MEELVRRHAKKLYKTTTSWPNRIPDKNLSIDISYAHMKRDTFQVTFPGAQKDLSDDKTPKIETLYKDHFKNTTGREQKYSISVSTSNLSFASFMFILLQEKKGRIQPIHVLVDVKLNSTPPIPI